MNDDPLVIAKRLGVALDQVGARWAVGGSVASSVHGIPRSTIDLDVIVALPPSKVAELAAASVGEFDFDADGLRAQLRQGRSYNIFHTPNDEGGPVPGGRAFRAESARSERGH